MDIAKCQVPWCNKRFHIFRKKYQCHTCGNSVCRECALPHDHEIDCPLCWDHCLPEAELIGGMDNKRSVDKNFGHLGDSAFKSKERSQQNLPRNDPYFTRKLPALERSPGCILNDIFKKQGIKYYPSLQIQYIGNAIKGKVPCGRSGCDQYDIFISHRKVSDADLAEKLYWFLRCEGYNVFLDEACLEIGDDWRKGFLEALMRSRCFLCLISRQALLPCKHGSCSDARFDHSDDNFLLEMQEAIRLESEGKLSIIPLFLPEVDGHIIKEFNEFDSNIYCSDMRPTESRTKRSQSIP